MLEMQRVRSDGRHIMESHPMEGQNKDRTGYRQEGSYGQAEII